MQQTLLVTEEMSQILKLIKGGVINYEGIIIIRLIYSLPHNKDNPFISGQSKEKPRGSQNDVTKKVGGWNPFEDTVNFGAVTEDYLFGKY